MKNLLEFIVKGIAPDAKFTVDEETDADNVGLTLTIDPASTGIIIGKGGRTIKAIRSLLRIRATLEKKTFFLVVNPNENP